MILSIGRIRCGDVIIEDGNRYLVISTRRLTQNYYSLKFRGLGKNYYYTSNTIFNVERV